MSPKLLRQIIGASVGLLIGLLILLIGFGRTLLLCLLALLGWWVCGGCVISEPVRELMERIKQQIMQK
jgi:uncharacterized membrane protein